jgi:hypothetical protein
MRRNRFIAVLFVAWLALAASTSAQMSPAVRVSADASTGTAVLVQADGVSGTWLLTAYHNLYRTRVVSIENHNRQLRKISEISEGPLYVLTHLDVVAVRVHDAGARWLGVTPARLSTTLPDADGGTYGIGNPKLILLGKEYYPYNYRADGGIGKRERANVALTGLTLSQDVAEQDILLLNDFTITYGFSGGPLFAKGDPSQALLGIVQGGDASTGKIAWATPADSIAAALTNLGNATPLSIPLGASTAWPERGFQNSVYSAATSPPRFRVDDYTPNPLTFHRGQRTDVELRVLVSSHPNDPHTEFVIDPLDVPDVEHVSGLDPQPLGEGFFNFRFGFVPAASFDRPRVTLPFAVRDAKGNELARFPVKAWLASEQQFEGSIGVALEQAPTPEMLAARVSVGVAPELDIAPNISFALRVEAGLSTVVGHSETRDPSARSRVLEADVLALGPSARLLPELRFWRYRLLGLRVAAGAFAELFYTDALRWRVGFPVQIGIPIQLDSHALVPQLQVAYERIPIDNYRYAGSLTARVPEDRLWTFSFGAGCSYVASF